MASGHTRQKASWDNWYRWKEHREWQWHGRHALHLRDMVHTQICRLQLQNNSYFSPHLQIPLFTLGSVSACVGWEQSPGWRPQGRFHPSLPQPWAPGVERMGWLFPTSVLFSRMQQALWKPGRLGLSISLWYLTCQLCISAGNSKCNCDIIIIITGKWAKDAWQRFPLQFGHCHPLCVFCCHNLAWARHKCPEFIFEIHQTHHYITLAG